MNFEVHSRNGVPLFTYDNEHRAREEMKRRGLKEARLYRVTKVLEEMPGEPARLNAGEAA